jgi:hypothetical protein
MVLMGLLLATPLAAYLPIAGSGSLSKRIWWSLFVLGALGVGFFRGLRIYKMRWLSFELVVDGDSLTRRQANTPDIVIHRSEVTSVHEVSDRGLTIKGPSRFKMIAIASTLEGYDQLAAELRQWGPAHSASTRREVLSLAVLLVFVWGTLGLAGLALGKWAPALSTSAAAILAAVLIWGFAESRRSPHFDAGMRRAAWLAGLYKIFLGKTQDKVELAIGVRALDPGLGAVVAPESGFSFLRRAWRDGGA